MKTTIALLLLMVSTLTSAVEIYDKETGKYLGQLGGSQYALTQPTIPMANTAVNIALTPSTTLTVLMDRNTATTLQITPMQLIRR